MNRSQSLVYRGRRHIPLPTGCCTVGCVDVITVDSRTGNFIRLFYPSEESDVYECYLQWPQWIPSKEYIIGSAIRFGFWPKFFRAVWNFLVGRVYIPTVWHGSLSQSKDKYPVVVFSHGLGGWRNAYSTICLEFASHGFIVAAVEHRDHSACATYYLKEPRMSTYGSFPGLFLSEFDKVLDNSSESDWLDVVDGKWEPKPMIQAVGPLSHSKEWLYYRNISKDHEELIRNKQVKKRAQECAEALDLLHSLNDGTLCNNYCSQNFPLDCFKGRLDLSTPIIAGHSFGGATAILTLAIDLRFRIGIALDPWMFPLSNEQHSFAFINQPLLCLSTDWFHDRSALQCLKQLSTSLSDGSFLSIKGSYHRDQCDLPFVGNAFFSLLGKTNCSAKKFTIMDLTTQLMLKFLNQHLGTPVSEEGLNFIYSCEKFLRSTLS